MDPHHAAWPNAGFFERAKSAHHDLRAALVAEVRRRDLGHLQAPFPEEDPVLLTRSNVEPMVRGLFPKAEQDVVLALLEKSVVFITSANIASLLLAERWDHTAWTLANLYLSSVGADLLAIDAPRLLG